jgi:uncharacterized protein involved in exopolysaccharide biosynthesis
MQQSVQGSTSDAEESVDRMFGRILAAASMLSAGRALFGVVFALVMAVALAFAYLTDPIYKASVVVAYASDEEVNQLSALGAASAISSLIGIDQLGGQRQSESLAILGSREFSQGFIEQERLMPVLFESKWDAKAQTWSVREPEDVPTLEDAWRKFDRDIRLIAEDKRTGLVTLTIRWKDRVKAAQWANGLIARANDELRARAIKETELSLKYLNEQLDRIDTVEMRGVLYQLVETQVRRQLLAAVRPQYAFTVVDPAVVPDAKRFDQPNRPLVLTAGACGGLILASVVVLVQAALRSALRHRREGARKR